MKCLTCFNLKGGSGCTRTLKALAYAMCSKYRVCIVDINQIRTNISEKQVGYHHIPCYRKDITALLDDLLAVAINYDYVLLDFPKDERGRIYSAFLAAGVIDYTVIPTNEDPLSISCTLEFAKQIRRRRSEKIILLNDIEPEDKQYSRTLLSKVCLPVFQHIIPHITDIDCPDFSRLINEQKETLEIIIRDFTSLML